MAATYSSTKDSVLVVSLILSVVSLVLLFGVTWYFQSSLSLLQQQVDNDRELLVKLQEQVKVIIQCQLTSYMYASYAIKLGMQLMVMYNQQF